MKRTRQNRKPLPSGNKLIQLDFTLAGLESPRRLQQEAAAASLFNDVCTQTLSAMIKRNARIRRARRNGRAKSRVRADTRLADYIDFAQPAPGILRK